MADVNTKKNGGLMYTFANVFGMQLTQIKYYDSSNKSCSNAGSCGNDTNNADVAYDGYIFPNDKTWKRAQNASVQATCEGLGPQKSYLDNITAGMKAAGLVSSTGSSTEIITASQKAVCCVISSLYDLCSGSDTDCKEKCKKCEESYTCS